MSDTKECKYGTEGHICDECRFYHECPEFHANQPCPYMLESSDYFHICPFGHEGEDCPFGYLEPSQNSIAQPLVEIEELDSYPIRFILSPWEKKLLGFVRYHQVRGWTVIERSTLLGNPSCWWLAPLLSDEGFVNIVVLQHRSSGHIELFPAPEEANISPLLRKFRLLTLGVHKREERRILKGLVKLLELGNDWLKALPFIIKYINKKGRVEEEPDYEGLIQNLILNHEDDE